MLLGWNGGQKSKKAGERRNRSPGFFVFRKLRFSDDLEVDYMIALCAEVMQ